MKRRALAFANLLLAGLIIAVGLPGILAAFRMLPATGTVNALEHGAPVDAAAIKQALPVLESAAATSPVPREELGLALLAEAEGDRAADRLGRAVRELTAYLAEVPGDSRAWVLLSEAELRLGARRPALEALKMSILTAPRMSGLLMTRCALGLILYAELDHEARGLVEEQFRFAAEDQTENLVRLVQSRRALLLARVLLAASPEAMAKFEAKWAGP